MNKEIKYITPDEHGLGPFNIKCCDKAFSIPNRRWDYDEAFITTSPTRDEIIYFVSEVVAETNL